MAMYIIMTSDEADTVRDSISSTAPYYIPIIRANDVYILPISILSSQPHEEWWNFLRALPEMNSDDPNFPGPYNPPEE